MVVFPKTGAWKMAVNIVDYISLDQISIKKALLKPFFRAL
jgi:hypothetical protein